MKFGPALSGDGVLVLVWIIRKADRAAMSETTVVLESLCVIVVVSFYPVGSKFLFVSYLYPASMDRPRPGSFKNSSGHSGETAAMGEDTKVLEAMSTPVDLSEYVHWPVPICIICKF